MAPAEAGPPIRLYAAGSLKAPMAEIARGFESASGMPVALTLGASGLLRRRIEGGERADIFASADMAHPYAVAQQRGGAPVLLFARNALCALVRGGLGLSPGTLLDALLDPALRIGTSTPGADPSGDYAWRMFAKADAVRPGARGTLEGKALRLTGAPDAQKAPEGRNFYGWVMESDRADVFLTYRTNAILARDEVPSLQIVSLPPPLAVAAEYGMAVLDIGDTGACRFAFHVLSPEGQRVLTRYGFDAPGMPSA